MEIPLISRSLVNGAAGGLCPAAVASEPSGPSGISLGRACGRLGGRPGPCPGGVRCHRDHRWQLVPGFCSKRGAVCAVSPREMSLASLSRGRFGRQGTLWSGAHRCRPRPCGGSRAKSRASEAQGRGEVSAAGRCRTPAPQDTPRARPAHLHAPFCQAGGRQPVHTAATPRVLKTIFNRSKRTMLYRVQAHSKVVGHLHPSRVTPASPGPVGQHTS